MRLRTLSASTTAAALAAASVLVMPAAAAASTSSDSVVLIEGNGERIFVGDPNRPENLSLLTTMDSVRDVQGADMDSSGTIHITVDDWSSPGCGLVSVDPATGHTSAELPITMDLGGSETWDDSVVGCGHGFHIDENDVAWATFEFVLGDDDSYIDAAILGQVDLATGVWTPHNFLMVAEGEPLSSVEGITFAEEGILVAVTADNELCAYDLGSAADDPWVMHEACGEVDTLGYMITALDARGDEGWALAISEGPSVLFHLSEELPSPTGDLMFGDEYLFVTAMFFAPAPATPSMVLSSDRVGAGDVITVTGANFPESTVIDLELHSLPMALGSVTTNGAGEFSVTVTIPLDAPSGAHSVVALVDGDAVATAALTVAATLAATGSDAAAPLAIGALLLVLGALALGRARRSAAV